MGEFSCFFANLVVSRRHRLNGTRGEVSRVGDTRGGMVQTQENIVDKSTVEQRNESVSLIQRGYEEGRRDCEACKEKGCKWMGMGGRERDGEERLGKLRRLGRVDFGALAGAAPSEL